jgi:hypothetical protein
MKNPTLDDLSAQQARESIMIRLEAFADEFERVAATAKQRHLAGRFTAAVSEIPKGGPLTAAGLEPLGEWLKGYGDGFEELARTSEQKELATSFRKFVAQEVTNPEVNEVFQRPLRKELIDEISTAMAHGVNNGVPFAGLSKEGKKEFLSVVIDWTDYINRGLEVGRKKTCVGIARIVDNAIAGKPSEEWMGRPAPLAESYEKVLNRQAHQIAKTPEKGKDRGIER